MTTYLIRLHDGADRGAVIAALPSGGISVEFRAISKLIRWDGPDGMERELEAVEGVRSVSRDDDTLVSPSQTHLVPYGAHESSGQLPLVWHGLRPGDRYYNHPFDLIVPGKAAEFQYDPTETIGNGTGVNIYVVDSGVDGSHSEFSGRFGGTIEDVYPNDPLGLHGTWVASVACGNTLGVAPGATVYNSRVFPSSGNTSVSNIASGIDAALVHYQAGTTPGLIIASFEAETISDPWDAIIESCTDAGLLIVAAAGNSGRNLGITSGSQNVWPAENPDVLTAGGTDERFRIHPGSNYSGRTDVYSSWHGWTCALVGGGRTGPHRLRGTSFSAPMTAGVAARMLTNGSKLTSREEVAGLKSDLLSIYTVEDVSYQNGSAAPGLRRLYVPGVSLTGFSEYAPPVRGIPTNIPMRVDHARTHAAIGSRADGITLQSARTHAAIGSRADGITLQSARTHIVVEE